MLDRPGMRGLVALPLVLTSAFVLGLLYVRRLGSLHPLCKVTAHAVMQCIVAAFFWLWAGYKSLHDSDLGVVSFLVAFLAAYCTARMCAARIARAPTRSKDPSYLLRMQIWLPVASFVPMLNYLLVLALNPKLPFYYQLYLCAGTGTWGVLALRGGWLLGEEEVTSSLRDERRPVRTRAEPEEERHALCPPDEEGRL